MDSYGFAAFLSDTPLSVFCPQAGGKSHFHALRKLEPGKCAVDLGFVHTGAVILKTDTQRATVGSQSGKGETPALCFGQTLAQLKFIADRDTGLFQRIQELIKGFITQTTHFCLRQVWRMLAHVPSNAVVANRLT